MGHAETLLAFNTVKCHIRVLFGYCFCVLNYSFKRIIEGKLYV
jgi:hypothetical protein